MCIEVVYVDEVQLLLLPHKRYVCVEKNKLIILMEDDILTMITPFKSYKTDKKVLKAKA